MSEPATRQAARTRQRGQDAAGPAAAPTAGDKTRIPRPSVPLLHRPRVTGLIERAAARRVTLVCGPTGAGKTVACAQWAAQAADRGCVAWLSLDPGDRSPGRLWADVVAALSRLRAVPADLVANLSAADSDAFPIRLVEATERLAAPVTLVIDDLQEIVGSDVLPGVDLLVRHGSPGLRLLLSGRHPAGIAVARLRVGGDLAEIGAADLACTPQEVNDYFAMLGLSVSEAQRDELMERTLGWMTGLRLAALRAAPGGPVPFWRIRGDEPVVADYLRDEVLAALPADRQRFLLRTSVADRICGALADAMTGGTGGAAQLDQLCRENVMVHPVRQRPDGVADAHEDEAEYRYHPLLLESLRAELRRELGDEVPVLARRAARWQASHGRLADAVRGAVQADDWDLASRLLAAGGHSMLLPGPGAELEPVLATCPEGRCATDAAVACTLAAACLRAGDARAATAHLANARRAIGGSTSADRRTMAVWMQALTLMSVDGRAPADAGLVASSLAIATRCESEAASAAEHQAAGLLWYAIGVTALAGADIPAARNALALASRHASDGVNPEFADRAEAWHALAASLHGDLRASDQLVASARSAREARADRQALLLADLAAAFTSLARDETGAARRLLERHERADAALAGTHGSTGTDGLEDTLVAVLAAVARARLALLDGDAALARNVAARLREHARGPFGPQWPAAEPDASRVPGRRPAAGGNQDRTGASLAAAALALLEADIAIHAGDPSRARLTLVRAIEHVGDGPAACAAALQVATARAWLAAGRCQEALKAADDCLDGVADHITLQDQVTALITAAVGHRRLGESDRAAERLAHALALAEPHGMYRPFLDGGAAARSALTVLIRPLSPGAAFAGRILQRYDTCQGRPAEQHCPGHATLTSSEIAVLRFLPSHMTNQEIAEALFLSINTVKTHLRSVYRKLGVTTRRQAISHGGRLGLL